MRNFDKGQNKLPERLTRNVRKSPDLASTKKKKNSETEKDIKRAMIYAISGDVE